MTGRHASTIYAVCAACHVQEDRHAPLRHPFFPAHPWNLRPGGKHRAPKPGSAAGDYTPHGLQRLARGA